ncbi:hypothetical protein PCE1_003086 [Barthelona sp. PCE]
MNPANLFSNIPEGVFDDEVFTTLLETDNVKIERILSCGQTSEEYYDQEEGEFVVLLRGNASLEFLDGSGEKSTLNMTQGSYVFIKPHHKHKVTFTSEECVWLCIFIKN